MHYLYFHLLVSTLRNIYPKDSEDVKEKNVTNLDLVWFDGAIIFSTITYIVILSTILVFGFMFSLENESIQLYF